MESGWFLLLSLYLLFLCLFPPLPFYDWGRRWEGKIREKNTSDLYLTDAVGGFLLVDNFCL